MITNYMKRVVQDSYSNNIHPVNDFVLLRHYFNFLIATMTRSKASFTLVFVAIHSFESMAKRFGLDVSKQVLEQTNAFLLEQTRNSDLIFTIPNQNEWVFLLPQSTQRDAKYFLKRIFTSVPCLLVDTEEELTLELSASVIGISHSKVNFEEVLGTGKEALGEALRKGPFEIQMVETFMERDVETIKISIIESDIMIQNVLQTLLQRTAINYFNLEIQTFDDGDQFLQSSWYQSGHTHIVMLNDILPKKSGIEVLQELRRMPNTMKYIIFMLSKGRAEDDMIYAYDMGVDEYISKPFNIKLVEAQLKRWLKRLRS